MKQYSIIKNKPILTQSRLFLEVSSVIGKVAALEELTLAYREYRPYNENRTFEWEETLVESFEWYATPQGDYFWDKVYMELHHE